MKVIALSRSKEIGQGCIDASCKNPDCEYFTAIHSYVDGGCANIPRGSIVQLRCSHCNFTWESTWFLSKGDPKTSLVKIHPTTNHLFSGLNDEDARKLSDVLIEIYGKYDYNNVEKQ